MNRIGVIDIGANSIKLMLTEVEESGYFRIIDELTSSVRLCYDLINDTKISDEKINETVSILNSFKSLCSVSGAREIIAVATEAFSFATNKDILLERISEELNINVIPLSNDEEIYYTALGINSGIYVKNSLMVDIGGSSTHLAWIKDGEVLDTLTLPIGTINLTYEYNLQDRILSTDLENVINHINELVNECTWLKTENFDSIIGVGGTVRAIGRIDRLRKRYPLDVSHQYVMDDLDVHEIYNLLKCKDLKQRRKVEGLSFDRSDLIIGGISIFQCIVNQTNNQSIVISGCGLREGVMYEYINTHFTPIDDILDNSINGLIENLKINKSHAEHVCWLSQELFKSLSSIHKLGDNYSHILKTASMLHDCGISIEYYNHHKHSFYIILNSSMNGLTHKELLMSAAIAAYHRNNSYHVPIPRFCSVINRLDAKIIEFIGVLIRIAEGLDRSLEGAVKDIEVQVNSDNIKLLLTSDFDLDFEIRQALRSADKFKEFYQRELIIEKV